MRQSGEDGEGAAEPRQAPEPGERPGQPAEHEPGHRATAGHADDAGGPTGEQAQDRDPLGCPEDRDGGEQHAESRAQPG